MASTPFRVFQWIMLSCLPLMGQAQVNAELYNFNSEDYRVSNWLEDGRMKILIEKWDDTARALSVTLKRLDNQEAMQVADDLRQLWLDTATKRVLGFYGGIDTVRYLALVGNIENKQKPEADKILRILWKAAQSDTSLLAKYERNANALLSSDSKLGQYLEELQTCTDDPVRLVGTNIYQELGSAVVHLLLKKFSAKGDSLKIAKEVIQQAGKDWEADVADRKRALKAWNAQADSLIRMYPGNARDKGTELRKGYGGWPGILDTLATYCLNPSSAACTGRTNGLRTALKGSLDKWAREFSCSTPLTERKSTFIKEFADGLMSLSRKNGDSSNTRANAEALAEVNFYRMLLQILDSPTPDAGELCVQRELMVYKRLSSAENWARRIGYRKKRKYGPVVIVGSSICGKAKVKEVTNDTVVKELLDIGKESKQPNVSNSANAVKQNGNKETTSTTGNTQAGRPTKGTASVNEAGGDTIMTRCNARRITEAIKRNPKLDALFVVDTLMNPFQITIVGRKRYVRRHVTRRPRHRVLRARGLAMLDDHERHLFTVKSATVKFENGVIEAIKVEGTVHERRKYMFVGEGSNSAKVYIPYHYSPCTGTATGFDTMNQEVIFTNSNTPIPFGNVWDLYDSYLDRMPLYGYVLCDGSEYRRAESNKTGYRGTGRPDFMLTLSDLLQYSPAFQNATSNIAPGDTTIIIQFPLLGDSDAPYVAPTRLCAGLKKENLMKIGEFKAFTDLVGLAEKKPNGLLQAEYAWRIPWKPRVNQGVNFIPFVEPSFTLVLREEEEKRAFVGFDTLNTFSPHEVDPLDLLAYKTYSVGMKITAVDLSLRYLNSTIELNPFANYTRTLAHDSIPGGTVKDSLLVDPAYQYFTRKAYTDRLLGGIGQFTTGFELRWKMQPDSRFGFDAYAACGWHYIIDKRFVLPSGDWERKGFLQFNMLAAGLDAHLFANAVQKFFFKFRWTGNMHDRKDHYVQLMFGYTRSLNFAKKKE